MRSAAECDSITSTNAHANECAAADAPVRVCFCCLSSSDSFVKLSGFQQFAYNPLQAWLQQSGKELVIEKVSTRGANWGMLKVDNHRIHFVDKEDLTIFDMPITGISQTVVQGKGEVTQHTHSNGGIDSEEMDSMPAGRTAD